MHRELASYRRAAYQMRFLEQVASSPRPEVAWDVNKISESVEGLSAAPPSKRAAHLIARLFANSEDSDLRFTCLRALRQLDIREAHNELWRLSQDSSTAESWRAICLLYLNPASSGGSVALAGGGQ